MKVNAYLAPTYVALVFLSYVSPYLKAILYQRNPYFVENTISKSGSSIFM